ncbi:MAG: hypothetical protein JRG89_05920 [Deltaproteobacteria bacterium]|nr:hypothetical protein [Deltaproteobacteria bacterium]MBW2387958.1 hypothetical protein [Deltaproteobacteria bacterium]
MTTLPGRSLLLPSLLLPLWLFVFATLTPPTAVADGQGQGDPRLDYMLQCQGCHGAHGTSKFEAGVPSMIGLAGRFLGDPEGRAYLVQVPGVSQAPLDDRAIADLLNWILERFGSEGDRKPIEPYTQSEVTAYRAMEPIDVAATRARLIERNQKRPTRTE